jgi:hypothetical protein
MHKRQPLCTCTVGKTSSERIKTIKYRIISSDIPRLTKTVPGGAYKSSDMTTVIYGDELHKLWLAILHNTLSGYLFICSTRKWDPRHRDLSEHAIPG